jgi:tetratricopeptide (TPR) repeat protein
LAFTVFAAALASAARADDNSEAGFVAEGQQEYSAGHFDQAIASFSKAATIKRDDPAAWSGLGNAFYAKGDVPNALKYLRFSLQVKADPQLAAFVQKLADLTAKPDVPVADPMVPASKFYAGGQYDQAIQQYNAAIAADPNNGKAYQALGNCFYSLKDKDRAVAAYRRALLIQPNNPALKAFLARYAPEAAQAAGVSVGTTPPDWEQPAWRSAILPGWGQAYNGEPSRGYTIGGVTIAALLGTVITYVIGSNARNSYNTMGQATQAKYDTAYNTWNEMANANHVLALGTLALYTFNIADAIMGAKPGTEALGAPPTASAGLRLGLLDNGTFGAKVRILEF